jgi:hypothetical protein
MIIIPELAVLFLLVVTAPPFKTFFHSMNPDYKPRQYKRRIWKI